MSLQDLVLKNRSYRRFDQSQVITTDQLKKMGRFSSNYS